MKIRFIIIILVSTMSLSAQQWIPLFNGRNLNDWEHVGDGSFIIKDSLLQTQNGMGLLWFTKQKFGNTKIRVVYKGGENNNAGVFIRIPEKPTDAWMPVNKGYEVQIDDREDAYHSTGVLYSFTKAKATPGITDSWNTMIITLKENRTIVYINDVIVTDFTDGDTVPKKIQDYEPDRGPRPVYGYIGLQNHGKDDVIFFKEISYQKLSK